MLDGGEESRFFQQIRNCRLFSYFLFRYLIASCDFESDRCTWTNTLKEDDFDWIVSKGSTPSGSTGPAADHTKRNGDGMLLILNDIFLVYSDIKLILFLLLS